MGTWTADVRCLHRKACIIATKEKCLSPATHDATVDLLLRLWSNSTKEVASPIKRPRMHDDDQNPLSPVIASDVNASAAFNRSNSPFSFFEELP
jgi:hypothetical protein